MIIASSSEKGFVSIRDEVPAVLKGMSRDECPTGKLKVQQYHEHLKVDLFGLTNHPRDPIPPVYPSKSVAALTTPVLKGAISKAQKD